MNGVPHLDLIVDRGGATAREASGVVAYAAERGLTEN
jgi:hypothetical protein